MAFLFTACEDEYHVDLEKIYGSSSESSVKVDKEIITCGDTRMMIVNIGEASMTTVPYVWEWNSQEATDISSTMRNRLNGMDECKVVNDGDDQLILFSSSGGAAGILSRDTKQCVFTAENAPGAHSIELLPNDRVAVALSANPGGGIQVYDRNASNQLVFMESLNGAHGVVWMENRNLLYAVGYSNLVAYRLKDWDTSKPSFEKAGEWELPTEDGHDLIRISNNELGITTSFGVYVFNITTEVISEFEPLRGETTIKSFNYEKDSGYLVYTKADIDWWTHNILIRNPNKTITISNVNLYKVRTVPERE